MEKRKALRVPISMEVTYESGDDFLSSFLSDVSGGGVFIGTPKPLELDTQLRICFHVPGISESLMVNGTVVWVRELESSFKPGMGVRFDEIDPEDRKRLDQYLEEQKKV